MEAINRGYVIEVKHYLIGLFSHFYEYLPLKIILAILYWFYTFFFDTSHQTGYIALLTLIVLDFITALIFAYKTGVVIESRKVFRTALKIATYFTLVSAGHLTEVAVETNLFIDETVIAFLAITELISILENIGKLGYAIPLKLLNKLEELRDSK